MIKDTKNSILFITTAFPPDNAIGAVRMSKFVKYLVRDGNHITLVTPAYDEYLTKDEFLTCEEFNKIEHILIPQSKLFNKIIKSHRQQVMKGKVGTNLVTTGKMSSKEKCIKTWFFRYARLIYIIIRNYDWMIKVSSYLIKHENIDKYSVIFSSYPSLGAMWAAAKVKRRCKHARWIADFRDPLNYKKFNTPLSNYILTLIQKNLIKKADIVTTISSGVGSMLGPLTSGKLEILTNGFDPDDFLELKKRNRAETEHPIFSFCYAGGLAGGERDITELFKAIKLQINNNKLNIRNIVFNYAGPDFSILSNQASIVGLKGILVNKGVLNREEALKLQMESSLIVVCTWNTLDEQGIMTGKIYEAFGLRKPVIGVVNGDLPESEFKKIIELVGGGFVIEESSINLERERERLADFIEKCYNDIMLIGEVDVKYNECVHAFSYKDITDSLMKLM